MNLNTIRLHRHSIISRMISSLLIIQLVFPAFLVGNVQAEVIADPSVDVRFRPNIQIKNQVPVVNIVAPDNSGVSHNQYTAFSVDENGLVFNNSLISGNSRLAGSLVANPLLGGRSASTILNEITGISDSQLKGVMEVFGNKSNVIIANPNGITCDGCGFINTERLSLTTGRPFYQDENLGFSINEGVVHIGSEGLSHRFKPVSVDVLSRYITIGGEINIPGTLNVISGSFDFDYATSGVSPLSSSAASTASAPMLAIDASEFGAMQAGKINIIGTEAGLGVKADGYLFSHADDLFISSAGGLSVSDVDSFRNLTLQADGKVSIKDDLISNQAISVSGDQIVTSTSSSMIARTIELEALDSIDFNGNAKALEITSKAKNQVIRADLMAINELVIEGDGTTQLVQSGLLTNDLVLKSQDLNVKDSELISTESTISADKIDIDKSLIDSKSLEIKGQSLSVSDSNLLSDSVDIQVGEIRSSAGFFSADEINIKTSLLESSGSKWSAGRMDADVSGDFISSDNAFYVKSGAFTANAFSSVDSEYLAENLELNLTDKLTSSRDFWSVLPFSGSEDQGFGYFNVSAGAVELSDGTQITAKEYTLAAEKAHYDGVGVYAIDVNHVTTEESHFTNGNVFQVVNDASIDASTLTFNGVIKTGSLSVKSDNTRFSGQLLVSEQANIDVANDFQAQDWYLASKVFSATASAIDWLRVTQNSESSSLLVSDDIMLNDVSVKSRFNTMSADSMSVDTGSELMSERVTIATAGDVQQSGVIMASDLLDVTANNIVNAGDLASFNQLTLSLHNDLINQAGANIESDFLSIDAINIDNEGRVSAFERSDIEYQALRNSTTAKLHASDAVFTAKSDTASIENYGEHLVQNAIIWLTQGSTSGSYTNHGQLLGQNLSFSGIDNLQNNATGLISVLYTDTDNPAQTVINSNRFTNQGRIESDSLVINLNTFRNEGDIHSESLNADIVNAFDNNGFVVVAGNADVSAKNFNNLNQVGDDPEFSVGGKLVLLANQITNQSGSVIAMHSGDLHTVNLFNRAGGSISALTDMTVSGIDGLDIADRASVVDNYGDIITGADLSVSSNRITNRADAVLSSARNARLSFEQLQNNSLIVVERELALGDRASKRSGSVINSSTGELYAGQIDAYLSGIFNNNEGSKLAVFGRYQDGLGDFIIDSTRGFTNRSSVFVNDAINFNITGNFSNGGVFHVFSKSGQASLIDLNNYTFTNRYDGDVTVAGDLLIEQGGLVNSSRKLTEKDSSIYEEVLAYEYRMRKSCVGDGVGSCGNYSYFNYQNVSLIHKEGFNLYDKGGINVGGNLIVEGNVSNSGLIGVGGDVNIVGTLRNTIAIDNDATLYKLEWDKRIGETGAELDRATGYGGWLNDLWTSDDPDKRQQAEDHLKDEIYFSNGVAYWVGPFNKNGTNVEAAEVKSTASGRNIANPNSLGIISVGQAISVAGSVDNKGTIVAESYSQNIVNKISEADRPLQQRPESVTTSLNNGLGEDTLQAAPGEKSDAINLLPFVFAGLDPNLLNAASVAGDKTPEELAGQAALQDKLSELGLDKTQNDINAGQTSGFNTQAPSLFDLDPSILNRIIADTEYELQPDYIFDRLKDSQLPDVKPVFFLDPYQEAQAITKAALAQTGTAYFSPDWSTSAQQRQALYDNTLAYVEKYQAEGNVKLGQALTRQQIQQLEQPMIWYVSMNIGGTDQLVPTVYLPEATLEQITRPSVGTIVADTMDVKTGNFTNTGNIQIKNNASIYAESFRNQRNVMTFGDDTNYTTLASAGGNITAGSLRVQSATDINNIGGSLASTGDMSLIAANNINLNAVELAQRTQNGRNISESSQFITSSVQAGGNASFVAGSNVNSQAASIVVDGDAVIDAENINLLGVTEREYEQKYSKKSGTFSSSRTTTQTEQLTFTGTELLAGGNLLLNARNNMTLQGAEVIAQGDATLNAENDILITAGINQDSYSKEKSGSGIATKTQHNQGYVKQEAVGSTIASGGNLHINSNGGDVAILASTVAAENNITMGDTNLLRDENGAPVLDDNGQYVSADGSSIGNLTIGTVELKDEEWDVKKTSLKGPLKDLATAAMFVAGSMGVTSQLEALGVDTTLTVGSSEEHRVVTTHNATSTVDAGGNLVVRVDDHLQVNGSQVNAAGSGYVETGSTTVTAVMDTTTTTESRSEQTVAATKPTIGQQEVTIAGVTATDHTETTTTYQETAVAAGLNINGNLIMNSSGDIALLGSDVNVGGDANLTAQNITVAGVTENSSTTHTEKTEVTTTSVGIKNAYVDAVYAADAVVKAGEQVEAAERALRDAEQRVKDGTLAASAIDDYKINLAAATTQLTQATLNLAASGATAAGTTGTGGFYATASAQTTTTEKESTSTSQNYVGSNINVGGNAAFNAADALSIMGSSVNVQEQLALNASSVIITAGTEESTSSSSEQTYSAGMSFSNSGGNDSFSANASANSSESDSYSKTHINSSINAGSLTSTSDQFTLQGGNVEIQNGIDITTGQLTIASLQDESRSRSSSEGYNISGSTVGGNQNTSSSDSKWVNNQTTLIGGASGNGSVNITADKTDITGATLASATRNEDGTLTDNGTLALITDELTITNLYDHNTSKSSGVNLSVGLGWSGDKPETEEREGYASGSTTLGLTNNGHNTEQTTYATLGGGTVQKKDGTAHDIADVNNDLNTTQEITLDQQTGGLDATVTVDHRWASSEGRNNIANNFVDTYEHGQDIGRTVSAVANEDGLGILNFGEALDKNAKGTQLKNDLLRNSENAHILAGLQSEDAEQYAQAMQALGQLAQNKFGLELSDINLYDASKTDSLSLADTALVNVKGGTVVDQNNQEYGNIFIDAGDRASKTDMTQTLGHEVIETQALQGKNGGLTNGLLGTNSAETKEAMANLFGAQLADRINQAAGGELNSSGGANFASNLQNSQAVVAGTQRADNVGTAKVEHRQLYVEEAQAIIAAAPAYAAQQGISEEQAKQDLTRQALRIVDQKWSEQIEENPDARAMLAEVAATMTDVAESPIGRSLADIVLDTETSKPFEAKDEETRNNTNINAREAALAENLIRNEDGQGFYTAYATENGEKAVETGFTDTAGQAIDNTKESVGTLIAQAKEDPAELLKGVAEGIYDGAKEAITSPLETFVYTDSEGTAADRQLIAELQGDATAARNEAADSLMETVSDTLAVPGVGRIVKNAAGEVVEEAGEKAAKQALSKADDVVRKAGDTDGEMIGQNGPTYDAVINSSRPAEEVNQEMINAGYVPAWTDGTRVQDVTLMPGYRAEQMIEKDALPGLAGVNPEQVLGRWAADGKLPNQLQESRDVTGVKEAWKRDPVIAELEVVTPLNVNRGSVREVYDEGLDRLLPGKSEQLEFIEGKKETYQKVKINDLKEFAK